MSLPTLGGVAIGVSIGALAGRLAWRSRKCRTPLALGASLVTIALEVTWLAGVVPSLCFALAAVTSAGLVIVTLLEHGHTRRVQ